jgi:nicotinate-nucleotide adenylyltransferase
MVRMMDTQEPGLRWLLRAREGIAARQAQAPRLGVLGGTFNPPTRAHLILAAEATRALDLHEVLFVLPETPPHKGRLEAPLGDRAEMLTRAIASEPRSSAAVCTHGLLLDIHRAVAPEYPRETRIIFLTGRDAAERILLHWPYDDPLRALDAMFARFEFGVAAREGAFRFPPESAAARHAAKVHSFRLPPEFEPISATHVRKSLARGESVDQLLPSAVALFIRERGLYHRRPGAARGAR